MKASPRKRAIRSLHLGAAGKATKKLLAGFGIMLLAGTGIGATAQVAQAADTNVGTVTNVRITDNAGNEIHEAETYSGIIVNADWEAPANATPGDYFEVTWPEEMLQGVPKLDFPIYDTDASEEEPIALCSVANGSLRCVYTDYVLTHSDTSGTVRYSAQLREETTEITFTTDSDIEFTWDIVVTPPDANGFVPPDHLWKDGHTDVGASDLYWQVLINPALFPGIAEIGVHDSYESSLTLQEDTVSLRWWPTGATNTEIIDLTLGSDYSVTFDTDNHAFDLAIQNVPERADGAYILAYRTDVPGDTVEGQFFHNEVTAHGLRAESDIEWTIAGGGSGSGSAFGTFGIEKALSGPAVEAGATTDFTGEWSCTLPGNGEIVAGNWAVTGAGAATLEQTTAYDRFPKLPKGTVCSATEHSAGADWAPEIISDDITISADPATITITNSLADKPVGNFTITKELIDEAGLVPAGTEFSGEYVCVAGTETTGPLPWTLVAGDTLTSEAVPAGALCTVTETTPGTITGGTWQAPAVSGDVTITGADSGLVTVTNTITADSVVEPPVVTPPVVTPPVVTPPVVAPPVVTPPAVTPAQAQLATTGAATTAAWIAVAVLLGTGAVVLLARRSAKLKSASTSGE